MQPDGDPYGLVDEAAIVVDAGRIVWVGPEAALPRDHAELPATDLGGALVTPALIDCHTHLVFGGDRALEFEMRLGGASYEDIARAGGGIMSTVRATRAASDAELTEAALTRLDHLVAEGVATVEVKSGYGLSIAEELRMLRIARGLQQLRPVRIVTTWLAAHALPPEYAGRAAAYIDEVAIAGLRAAQAEGLVDAVDGFCETIGFAPGEVARLFDAARALGLPVKLHAEQLSDQKGARLAAGYGAISADHLEYLAEADAAALAAAGTVAVLLPGAFLTLRETKLPPVAALRAAGVRIAVATDCNPGSSPLSSILAAMSMASSLFRLTPEEALAGTTRSAAAALGLAGELGVIAPGAAAELAVWNLAHPAQLSYWIGGSPLRERITQRALS